jgi:hypothetical protein
MLATCIANNSRSFGTISTSESVKPIERVVLSTSVALALRNTILRTLPRMQARRGPDLVCSRESRTPYALRGMLYCGVCVRLMQGAARVGKRTTRILYRCELGKSRSVPAELADHPSTVYVHGA